MYASWNYLAEDLCLCNVMVHSEASVKQLTRQNISWQRCAFVDRPAKCWSELALKKVATAEVPAISDMWGTGREWRIRPN